MVTVFSAINTSYKGLSTDNKPTKARNGDRFFEIDTQALLLFDEENMQWQVLKSKTDPVSSLVGIGRVGYMII